MNKIFVQLVYYLVLTIMMLVVGQCPAPIKIHPTGNASYVSGSYCYVFTDVPDKDFETLLNWCKELHHKSD